MATKEKPKTTLRHHDPQAWVNAQKIKNSGQVDLPDRLIDEVIGQDEAVSVAKKAARQGRHLLLLGDPGTGKSMIAKAMAEILPKTRLDDVLSAPNPKDPNQPIMQVLPGGQGRASFSANRKKARRRSVAWAVIEWTLAVGLVLVGLGGFLAFGGTGGLLLLVLCIMASIFFVFVTRQVGTKTSKSIPTLLMEHPEEEVDAPYVDATGSHAGALFGDVRHDPYQSGGLQTPTHQRVELGAIHKAHKGLLFIDEINVLRLDSQQALLTAMQEKKYSITGQSDKSSGAMVRTTPVPCDFILVAAGNMDVIDPGQRGQYVGLHPALRSRIRGYGYEVYVRSVMEDSDENRHKLVRFIAQEVRRDGKIPHLDADAISEVIREAQRRSGHSGKLTLRLRELGGLVRTAGDIARDDKRKIATVEDVLLAKRMSMSLESQVTHRGIQVTTAREALVTDGEQIGAAVGTAVLGTGETGEQAGLVVPVEANVTAAEDRQRGGLHLGGGLERDRTVAGNVRAMVKALKGPEVAGIDLHVQALLQQPDADLGALGTAAAVASISAIEAIPVRRDTVVLGALAVSGRLRAIDGVTQMIEGAADLGYKRAVVPEANRQDVLLEHGYANRIDVCYAAHLADALDEMLVANAATRKRIGARLQSGGPKAR